MLHPCVSGHTRGNKSDPLGVDEVHQVQSKVDERKHCHHNLAIPRTPPPRTRRRSPGGPIFSVKAEHRPHHRCTQVEQNFQEGAHHRKAVKGHAAQRFGPAAHGHYDHQCSQSEAENVDDNAVDCCGISGVLAPIGQSSEDDAGNKALHDFEEARDGGHVAHDSLARPGSAQSHLGSVGQSAQDGADGDSDAEISDMTAGVGALDSNKEEWVDHGGCHIPAGEDRKNVTPSRIYILIKPGKLFVFHC